MHYFGGTEPRTYLARIVLQHAYRRIQKPGCLCLTTLILDGL